MKREITVQLSILIALVFIGFQLFGCGYTNAHVEKDVITQQREVEDFDGIIVSGAFNVFISQGDKQKVIVEAPEEIIEKIQTKVKSGKLEIGNDGRILCYNNIKIYVTVTKINTIIASGASDIESQSLIKSNNLQILLSGAGDIDLNISCDEMSCIISGAGDATFKGNTDILSCVISGAGDLKSYDFVAETCKIIISGSGDAKINVNKEITATVSGAGDLRYKGSAIITKQIVTGAGSIKNVKDR